MAKLKLQLEDLVIDSFQTTAPERAKGTVFGEQCTCQTQCGQNTCPGCPTCDASCNGTCASCAASCNGTCDFSCNGTCDLSCEGTCHRVCILTDRTCYASCNPSYVDSPCEAC